MPNPLLIMEYANLYCGRAPDDDTSSNHLVLASVQLPTLEIQYVDHRAGGSPVSVEIDVIQTRMECRFRLLGMVPQVDGLLAAHVLGAESFFIYGNVRDYLTGKTMQAEAYLRGQLGRIEPSEFKRGGEPMASNYSIRGIWAYKLNIGLQPIYEWDFFQNLWSVRGQSQGSLSSDPLIGPFLPPNVTPQDELLDIMTSP